MGETPFGIDPVVIKRIANEVKELVQLGAEVSIVLGAGNFFRGSGLAAGGIDRVTADHMGMLATIMNSLAMQDALERAGMFARVMSAIKINQVCEDYIRRRAIRHLEKGRVVVFAAGKSVFYNGLRRKSAGHRSRCGIANQGNQGRRCLYGRPRQG